MPAVPAGAFAGDGVVDGAGAGETGGAGAGDVLVEGARVDRCEP